MQRTRLVTAVVGALIATPLLPAGSATFQRLPGATGANDMTPDGSLVVGTRWNQGYFWTERDGFTMIGGDGAVAVSDDGAAIFGTLYNEDGREEAAVWNATDGWQLQGGLDTCDFFWTSGYELSGDGRIGVGLAWEGCSGRGFRWTPEAGIVALETLANGGNRASVVSGDASLIAGFAQGTFSRTPAVWFPDLSGVAWNPDFQGEIHGMNDAGTIVLGALYQGGADGWYDAFRADPDGENIVNLGSLSDDWAGIAMDIADDGTIVGFDSRGLARRAWIRPPGGPTVSLEAYLEANGAGDVPGLQVAQAISNDGRVIIGHGSGAWVATLFPAACPTDVDGNETVDTADLLAIIAAWGPCGGCPEDIDENGNVDLADLLAVLSAWGPCP